MTRQVLQLVIAAGGFAMLAPTAFAQTAPGQPEPGVPDPTAPPPTDTMPTDDTRLPDPNVPSDPTIDTTTTGTLALPPEPTFEMKNRTYRRTTTDERGTLESLGFSLTAGGGVSGFTNESARDATQDGGGWDVRATIGTRKPLAAEISYLGSAQSIDALGIDDDAMLVGNGVQANLRLNMMVDSAVQPFIYAGAAWRHYDLTNTDTNTSDVAGSDDVVEFPVGVGLAYRSGGLILDARGEFRAATNEDLMPTLASNPGLLDNSDQASLHRWGINANVGFEF